MKYIVVLGDGMADLPLACLGGRTPLQYASTPMLDWLASQGEVGMVHTIPEGMKPGSDTANLSVLGYDPRKYYSGRSPLEALSIGVKLKATDVALRCNLVTLSEEEEYYEERRILDHSAGEISTEEASRLLEAVKEELETEPYRFYSGTSYRHLLIWEHGQVQELIQPHDVLGDCIRPHLPSDGRLREMMKRSYQILSRHPINLARKERGLNPANSCWFWGAGTRPCLSSFEEKYHLKGAMVSAVDLLKGIAVGASMKVIPVAGANGGLDTNYEGKAQAAVDVLTREGYDFVYVHVEAPDEMGHQGSAKKKVQAIEYLDRRVIAPIVEQLLQAEEAFRLLVLPDHPTPIALRTHTGDDVPYLLFDSTRAKHRCIHAGGKEASAGESEPHRKEAFLHYHEQDAAKSGRLIEKGHELIEYLIRRAP